MNARNGRAVRRDDPAFLAFVVCGSGGIGHSPSLAAFVVPGIDGILHFWHCSFLASLLPGILRSCHSSFVAFFLPGVYHWSHDGESSFQPVRVRHADEPGGLPGRHGFATGQAVGRGRRRDELPRPEGDSAGLQEDQPGPHVPLRRARAARADSRLSHRPAAGRDAVCPAPVRGPKLLPPDGQGPDAARAGEGDGLRGQRQAARRTHSATTSTTRSSRSSSWRRRSRPPSSRPSSSSFTDPARCCVERWRSSTARRSATCGGVTSRPAASATTPSATA